MKYITVNDQWKIKVDEYNYQLHYFKKGGLIERGKYIGGTSKDRWIALEVYCSTLESALLKVAELSLVYDETEEVSLGGYVDSLREIKEEFRNLITGDKCG